MLDPIKASKNIRDEFTGYISTLQRIADSEYAEKFGEALASGGDNGASAVTKGPFLDISGAYATGNNIEQLVQDEVMSSRIRDLEGNIPDGEKELKIDRPLYRHQEQAIRAANEGRSLIVTTGTGSGKTECFLAPILNHLLQEQDQAEDGKLTPGVRAILIYPMNALANDQMKRLRRLLANYPDITFGVYNGSTKYTEEEGRADYMRVFKDASGRPLEPLPNELLSREQMQQTPPHILLTNYAMLEYMMLRPKDDTVFRRAQLRYIVLDEAHVYRGTKGMEMSMLMMRLKARISNESNVQYILTSATLGGEEKNQDIIGFGKALCNTGFEAQDIIRAESVDWRTLGNGDSEFAQVPLEAFSALADPMRPLSATIREYNLPAQGSRSTEEYFFDLSAQSEIMRDLRETMTRPMTLSELVNAMSAKRSLSAEDIVSMITVATRAVKNGTPFLNARYHMFARALDGAYITLGKDKRVSLTRREFLDVGGGREKKAFEAAVCDDCGRLAVVGKVVKGKLEFASDHHSSEGTGYYLLMETGETIEADEDDDDVSSGEIHENDYVLCSKCGRIEPASKAENGDICDCGKEHYVRVRKAVRTEKRDKPRCPGCTAGYLEAFYLGHMAATGVLGTSLFEELPESEVSVKDENPTGSASGGGLFRKKQTPQVEETKRARQFLVFSDSRADAAFFATYMGKSYMEFLRRRGIWHVIEENKQSMAQQPWEIQTLVNQLTAYFDTNRTFAAPTDSAATNLTPVSRTQAWIAVLNEMVNGRRNTSLSSLGLLQFFYKGNDPEIMQGVADEYGISVEDATALFDTLVMDIVYHGALEADCNLSDDDRQYIYYAVSPKRVVRSKDPFVHKGKPNLMGWSGMVTDKGTLRKNARMSRLMRVLGIDEKEADELLSMYWDEVLTQGPDKLTATDGTFSFRAENFTVAAVSDATPVYRCDKCGRITATNCKHHCPTARCDGHLREVSRDSLIDGNHYASLYRSELMRPLHIKEHTAQLGREKQLQYQEEFVQKELNALSSSTTFEMGVDVGDLETVFLRNIPPTAANYVQRAGRAGRSTSSAAFTLSYAKLSSHDFTYYRDPAGLIMGKIDVPVFSVQNEKVVQRHIFAVALAEFFRRNEDVYNRNDADVLLNGDGWERLCKYLMSEPAHLKTILRKSIPKHMHQVMGISDFSWTDRLIGKDGVLRIAVEDFHNIVKSYEQEFNMLMAEGKAEEASRVKYRLRAYRKGKDDKCGTNQLIEFLVRSNVLPKYGFPVDTVELWQNLSAKQQNPIDLSRDLQLAISEYAPGSQVVADGLLYTSRYIRKSPFERGDGWELGYIAQCENPECGAWNHTLKEPGEAGKECAACGTVIEQHAWREAVEPRLGFIAEAETPEPPRHKPETAYRSDAYYIGDPQRQTMETWNFQTPSKDRFSLESTTNDALMVVCKSDFFLCKRCGYAVDAQHALKDSQSARHKVTIEKEHRTSRGNSCVGKLHREKLCHVFKTDVAHIVFETPEAAEWDTMLSVMYALLEGASDVLSIERDDIDGCLHTVVRDGQMIRSLVLYDKVAGGAGQVRRMVTKDGEVFRRVVQRAVEITKGCDCSPSCYSCLRNYGNQRIHDKLDREKAYKFLAPYAETPKRVRAAKRS